MARPAPGTALRRALLLLLLAWLAHAETPVTAESSPLQEIARLIESVRRASYPQLRDVPIAVHDLHSDFVFFESRFTASSFLMPHKLQYVVMFNREAQRRRAPVEALRAIVAHELAHIDYYQTESRMGLLGLVRLLWPSFNTRFERAADLEAIALGYGPGLEQYRTWLYRNIPAGRLPEKKRDYYSAAEIEAILRGEKLHPGIMRTFTRCVPRSLAEIESEVRNPAKCP